MARKLSRKGLVKKCDDAWSLLIRSKGACERCGRSEGVLHAHHIVGRRNRRTRWLEINGCCICYRCHRWAHEEPLEFADWIWNTRPQHVKTLQAVKNEIANHSDADLLAIREYLKAELELELAA